MLLNKFNITRSGYGWFFRYKVYHLPFWFVYHVMWWTLTIGSLSAVFNNIFFSPYAVKFLFSLVLQAAGVYFNLYFLIPRFLERGRYVPYLILLLLTVLSSAALIVTGYYVTAELSGKTFQELFKMSRDNYMYIFKVNSLPSTVASMTLAMSVKLTKNWIQAKQKEQLLEREKLETELKFLRSQFNPHFLFNTINSIFVLIHKNPHMASDALAKFSDLLRYQLYECNEHEIPVSQEISYLENFIELEKLRQDGSQVEVTLQTEQPSYLTIAPFVLIPFIENAFKHIPKGKDRQSWIRIDLRFEGKLLLFSISNSVDEKSSNSRDFITHRGIGLKNVKRRLDLIYSGRHKLTLEQDKNQFVVHLELSLFEHKKNEHSTVLVAH
ncbi:MAG TPA: histidine kinase [Chitinophagaceae bacterium]|nr:histidine kinase [Chitinophagaceae bacterium]